MNSYKAARGLAQGVVLVTTAWIASGHLAPVAAQDSAAVPRAVPVSFPLDIVATNLAALRDLAKTRPIAAAAILSILQNGGSPFAADTIGHAIYLSGVPTEETVQRMLAHASAGAILGSLQPLRLNPYHLEEGPYLNIWWDQTTLPGGETVLRISSMLVDGAGAAFGTPALVEAHTTVALREGAAEQLTWVQ